MSEIRDLVESYYNDVYIEEDQLDEATPQIVPKSTTLNKQTTQSRPGESAKDAANRAGATEYVRRGGIVGQIGRTLTRGFGTNKDIQRVDAEDKASQARIRQRVASSQGKYYSSSDNKTYRNYNDAVAARNSRLNANKPPAGSGNPPDNSSLPAGTPNLTVRVTPPGGAGKTAPTRGIVGNDNRTAPSTPTAPQKPAGSAMDQWRAANPKLAAAADEKARIRGTQQTDNPLMKDMRSRLPMNSPSVQSPDVAKLGAGNQSLTQNPNAFKAATPAPSTPSPTTTKTAFDLAKKGVDLSKK